jgi:hypothetical protein
MVQALLAQLGFVLGNLSLIQFTESQTLHLLLSVRLRFVGRLDAARGDISLSGSY